MTVVAGLRRGLVEQHKGSVHLLLQRVAGRAGDVFMSPLQRECCLVVIEKRRLPFIGVMAPGAIVCARAKLIGVRILVAIRASNRSLGELDVRHGPFHSGRAVTVDASHSAMGTDKRKVCRRMIKLR